MAISATLQGLRQFETAIEYHQRHLKIAKEMGDNDGEGISYGGLGNAYQGLGLFKTAIKCHQHSLEIAKKRETSLERDEVMAISSTPIMV